MSLDIQKNVSLRPYNTFAIDATADFFASVSSVEDIRELIQNEDFQNNKKLILGGGSNMLLMGDFHGFVVKNEIMGYEITKEDENYVHFKMGAGENWHEMVLYAIDKGWGGMENLSYIPGNVGASPMQNIGAYGVEMKDIFDELEAIELTTGETKKFTHEECRFGYRDSIFKQELRDKYLIVNVTVKLTKKDHKLMTEYAGVKDALLATGKPEEEWTIKDASQVVTEIRKHKLPDPKDIGTAGSFFKNPIVEQQKYDELIAKHPEMPSYPNPDGRIKIPAGWLIDQAGWKGWTSEDGTYGIHKNHALVLVNHGGAKGTDLVRLSKDIQNTVKEKFGILIEPEVNII